MKRARVACHPEVVLHNRAQVLLALCGIVVTTTGFSGRLVAGTNAAAQWLIIACFARGMGCSRRGEAPLAASRNEGRGR
ncbi:MAG: hypothetical protein WBD40_01570 [Tepidisphaeraceae bacterium]